MFTAVASAYRRYFDFAGRSNRAEYWWFFAFIFGASIFGLVLGLIGAIAVLALSLFSVIPSWAVFVRRLHDTGRSGWWWFVGFVPFVGSLLLLWFLCLPGDDGDNRFGPKPGAVVSDFDQTMGGDFSDAQ